jgi:integrase
MGLRPAAQEKIVNTLIKLKGSGLAESTLRRVSYELSRMAKQCDLDNTDDVKSYIADMKGANSYRDVFVKTYSYYVRLNDLVWERPKFRSERRLPRIPTKEALMNVISASSKKYAVIFKILMETGVMPRELANVSLRDIDLDRGILSVQGLKGHTSRSFKLKSDTLACLREYLYRIEDEKLFPDSKWMGKIWRRLRRRVAEKLGDPSFKSIRLYDLRHFYATNLYHKSKDILLVKQQLGHKKIETTLIYTQLVSFGEEDEFYSATANSVNEAAKLIEQGFDYICDIDAVKLFRKRK